MSTPHAVGAPPPPITQAQERTRLREAAEAFESILIQHLFRRMREAQLDQGFFGEATGASTYEAMFDEGIARQLAEGSPFGVADMLEAQWLERKEPLGEVRRMLGRAEAARASWVHEESLGSVQRVEPGPPPPERPVAKGVEAQVPPVDADE